MLVWRPSLGVCIYNMILQNCMVKWIHFQNVIIFFRVYVNTSIEIIVTYKYVKYINMDSGSCVVLVLWGWEGDMWL
jgi:hypothetical protein